MRKLTANVTQHHAYLLITHQAAVASWILFENIPNDLMDDVYCHTVMHIFSKYTLLCKFTTHKTTHFSHLILQHGGPHSTRFFKHSTIEKEAKHTSCFF